jgi:hypothetical protein
MRWFLALQMRWFLPLSRRIHPRWWSLERTTRNFRGVPNGAEREMASHLSDSFRNVLRPLAFAAAAIVALACATGPKDSLSGAWAEVGGGFGLSLRQSGSAVTGTGGSTPCATTPVSGSVHGTHFDLMVDTGAFATNYAGTFINASTISIQQSDVDVDIGAIFLEKDTTLGLCVSPQT